jgi:hypothetical protein
MAKEKTSIPGLTASNEALVAHQGDFNKAESLSLRILSNIKDGVFTIIDDTERRRIKIILHRFKRDVESIDPDTHTKAVLQKLRRIVNSDNLNTKTARARALTRVRAVEDRVAAKNPNNVLKKVRSLIDKCLKFWVKKIIKSENEELENVCNEISELKVLLNKSFLQEDVLKVLTFSILQAVEECIQALEKTEPIEETVELEPCMKRKRNFGTDSDLVEPKDNGRQGTKKKSQRRSSGPKEKSRVRKKKKSSEKKTKKKTKKKSSVEAPDQNRKSRTRRRK